MSSLAEIEAAATALSAEQQQELLRFLTAILRGAGPAPAGVRLVEDRGDVLLAAPPGAPLMTPEAVREILGDWP